MDTNTKQLLQFMINAEGCELTYSEIKTYIEDLEQELEDDFIFKFEGFIFEFEGVEHRIIHDSDIDKIALEEIEQQLKDCYELSDAIEQVPGFLQSFVSVDWAGAAQHCLSVDGYGHHFNSWDGSEDSVGSYYVFRLGA